MERRSRPSRRPPARIRRSHSGMRRAPPSLPGSANRISQPDCDKRFCATNHGCRIMQQAGTMTPAAGAEFAALLENHRRLVFKVANTYGRGRSDVEDLAQEIAAQCWRAFPGYDPARSFSTWLYRIALNVAISWLRAEAPRRRRSVSFDADLHDGTVTDSFDADDGGRILRGFIESRGPLER